MSQPKALLNLYYQYIIITLIRDPEGGPYKIIPKFTFEFTKEYLSIKEAHNKLPLPLHSDLDNIPVFQQLIKTPYGHKDLSAITGFRLRYGAGKAFNKNSNHADT
ncbi:hypothetical protein V2W45_1336257 [Cenococcum geophilum]